MDSNRDLYFELMENLCRRIEKVYDCKSEIDGGEDFMAFRIGERAVGSIRLEENHIFVDYCVPLGQGLDFDATF